ncbi:MAG: N-acetylglucosamine-6-phosphate deacetylase [Verrucomicrobia subdivision 3 bacterium]|nr:N-acetylglucosamine-6-phosphate deacetylase [Limisphaerales bacterium]MCS1413933.1 N-acetylglucosamine-6-phosphate deacetylase [Limisphaerales bacterium]
MQACLITNAHIISPGIDKRDLTIAIANGKIEALLTSHDTLPDYPVVLDAQRATVVPGFIDIHTHGAWGHDICDGNPDSLRAMAKAKLDEGVTTFLPTTLTLPQEDLIAAFKRATDYFRRQSYAKTPGFHVEGPFINPDCTGAQNPDYVRHPDINEIDRLHSILPVKIVSLAVEMPGGLDFVRSLDRRGIIPSLAHTAANFQQFAEAKAAGAKHLTHFCNQMTRLHHREIGLVGAGLLDDQMMTEIICDNVHLCPEMTQLALKVIGPERLMLITDSIAASGLAGNQTTTLGGLDIIVQAGVARLRSGALAGSTLKMNVALRNLGELSSLPLSELVRTTSLNQALSLGLDGLGKIEPDYWADLVVLNNDYSPRAVFVNGIKRSSAQNQESANPTID